MASEGRLQETDELGFRHVARAARNESKTVGVNAAEEHGGRGIDVGNRHRRGSEGQQRAGPGGTKAVALGKETGGIAAALETNHQVHRQALSQHQLGGEVPLVTRPFTAGQRVTVVGRGRQPRGHAALARLGFKGKLIGIDHGSGRHPKMERDARGPIAKGHRAGDGERANLRRTCEFSRDPQSSKE